MNIFQYTVVEVANRLEKLAIHALAVGAGAAVGAAVAGINMILNDPAGGIPAVYALAIGSVVADVARQLLMEIRVIDPTFDEPELPLA